MNQLLTTDEIKLFLDEDKASTLKAQAREGQKYYDGEHDILDLRMFYFNADDELVEDKYRSDAKILSLLQYTPLEILSPFEYEVGSNGKCNEPQNKKQQFFNPVILRQ